MKCPQCNAENVEGKNFCPDCGSLLVQLPSLVRAQVDDYIRHHFKDRNVVDVETTEVIAERFLKWGKWFLIPATFLLTILGVTLGIIGIRDYSNVHRAAEQAIKAASTATNTAQDATTKAQEAKKLAESAIQSIQNATAQMNSQLTSAKQIAERVSGLESKTAGQIANANKHVEERVTELDSKVEGANKAIAEQQSKLVSTNELVTAMFSKSQTEIFQTSQGNTTTFEIIAVNLPEEATKQLKAPPKAMVRMLLKHAAIYQTVQINFRIYVQPKNSLKQWPLEVSYVPDPTYNGPKAVSFKDGQISFDNQTH